MTVASLNNISGFSNLVLALNNESSGLLLTGLMFVFFIIVVISLFTIGNRNIWEVMAISGATNIIPSLILTTLYYNSVPAVKIWVVLFFVFIAAIGTGGMYFTKGK